MLPIAFLLQKLWFKPRIKSENFFGMSVNFDKAPHQTLDFVKDLNIKNLLIRFKMDDLDNIGTFKSWLQTFKDQEITLNIIQDPNMKKDTLESSFKTIFSNFYPHVKNYQIGTTINRSKWGFYSVNEYLSFFRTAYKLKKNYPGIQLLGPSVIDFEYFYTTQALFNPFLISYDACSALLYVDRTVTPENKQFGFNLLGKINLLYSLIKLSPKSKNRLIITETNWPIENSGKYSPTSDLECVSEEDFANYMLRYYLLALGSSKVEAVYWHQLIAVGFGLINPNKELQKRQAYFVFKTMVSELQDATGIKLNVHKEYYELSYSNIQYKARILWTNNQNVSFKESGPFTYKDKEGNLLQSEHLELTASPLYLINKEYL